MWLWTSQCWHSTLVPVSDRVCRQRSVRYRTMPRATFPCPPTLPQRAQLSMGAEILGHWGGVIVYHLRDD